MTIVTVRLETGLLHVNLFEQQVTIHWSRNLNLFGRHVHMQTMMGIVILSQFGIVVERRLSNVLPPQYRRVYGRGIILKMV